MIPFRDALEVYSENAIGHDHPVWAFLFKDHEKCMLELIQASQCNPRDLINLAYATYLRFIAEDSTGRALMNLSDVYAGIKFHFAESKRRELETEPYAAEVLKVIQQSFRLKPSESYKSKHVSRWLLIGKSAIDARRDHQRALQFLENARILHIVDTEWRPRGRRIRVDAYRLYSCDTGLIIDEIVHARDGRVDARVREAAETQYKDLRKKLREYIEIDESSLPSIVLDFPPHMTTEQKGRGRLCPSCGERFSSKHPVVLKARICPHCAHDLGGE